MANSLNKRSIGTSSTKKHDPTKKRKHKDSSKADKGPPRKGNLIYLLSQSKTSNIQLIVFIFQLVVLG